MNACTTTWVAMAMCFLATSFGTDYKLLFLAPMNPAKEIVGQMIFEGGNYASAMQVALNDIVRDGILPGHNLSFVLNDTKCAEDITLYTLAQSLVRSRMSAVIGPGCSCVTSASLAAAFNIPMISYMCVNPELSNKTIYPTFARTSVIHSHVAPSVIALMKHFRWKTVGIVCDNSPQWSRTFCEHLQVKMESAGLKPVPIEKHFPSHLQAPKWNTTQDVFDTIKMKARIVILAMHFETARFFMLRAYENNMVDGTYAYIFLDLDEWDSQIRVQDPSQWLGSVVNPTKDKQCKLRKAFLSMLTLRAKTSKIPAAFIKKIEQFSHYWPFNTGRRYNLTTPSMFGFHLYDAVYQYAVALNKTLANNEEPNGTAIINRLKGSRFQSILGYSLSFDQNADLNFNLTLVDVEHPFGCTPPNCTCNLRMVTVGNFYAVPNMTTEVELTFKRSKGSIHWDNADNTPPSDEPLCGFSGICITTTSRPTTTADPPLEVIFGVLGFISLTLVVLSVIICRRLKLENELRSQPWKIERRKLRLCSEEVGSYGTYTEMRKYSVTGRQESEVAVTVKVLCAQVSSSNLSRSLHLEFKQMRDIRHENLAQFFGACIETDKVLIVNKFYKRNLPAVLENEEQFKLEKSFIASLVYDIVKGMAFLHKSDIKSHGKLKSDNCLVDSRLVLTITDYGLPTLRAQHRKAIGASENCSENENLSSETSLSVGVRNPLFYVAPEILRNSDVPVQGTQKGDVYSFAIILQEFFTRKGPYSENKETDPAVIVATIEAGGDPPYRPTVPEETTIKGLRGLRTIMEHCWDEDSEKRPTFHEIKERLDRLLMDNRMKPELIEDVVLGLYTDHLDQLVEQKTQSLAEEKNKTDMLLSDILPRSVAEQLKNKKTVEAQSFSEVTIYFSDIVGFTSLSSESTPMQVVELLNDLYTLFDGIIEGYAVYKVETIGDAYMVVSGLPIENGHKHAGEICRMALHLVEAVKKEFTVRHKPQHKLMLRVGIHSGPVVAGVVGVSRPRYCLFGDTVNVASRMESTGDPLRIHISQQTNAVLQRLGGYITEERGPTNIKGKGTVVTYWLIDTTEKDPAHKRLPLRRNPTSKAESFLDLLQGNFVPAPMSRSSSLRHSYKRTSTSNNHSASALRPCVVNPIEEIPLIPKTALSETIGKDATHFV